MGADGTQYPPKLRHLLSPSCGLWPHLLPALGPSPPPTVQRLMAGHMCGRSCGDLSTPCLAVGPMASLR